MVVRSASGESTMIVEIGMKGVVPLDWSCVAYPGASGMNSVRFQEKTAAGAFTEPARERMALARALFRQSASQFAEGIAPWTLLTRYRSFRVFMSHADAGGKTVSLPTLTQRFAEWTRHLEERVAKREIAEHSQYGLVTRVAKQIADVLQCPLPEVMVGVRLKKPKRAKKRNRDKQNLEVTQRFVGDLLEVIGSLSPDKLRAGGPIELSVGGKAIGRVGSPTRTRTNASRCLQPALDVPPVLSSAPIWSPIPTARRLDVKKRFSEEQIIGFLREAEAGMPVKELCRRHGFSEASYYLWRSKFGGMSVPDAKRLKELETENARLKKLLAEQVLENEVIKDVLRKKW